MLLSANVREEGRRGDGEYTSEEITRPAVSTSGRCRVRPVGADHVVNGGHVDTVICDTHDSGEDARGDPGKRWPSRGPCETNKAER